MKTNRLKIVVQKLFIFQFLISGWISSCSPVLNRQMSDSQTNPDTAKLIISAAASMQDVLQEIRQLYLKQYPQANITFNFGSSGSLQHQIEQGAPVDIFISAAPQQMDNLAAKELLISETRQDLVANKMVLIVPAENKSAVNFQDLTKETIGQIALGEPDSVPAGKYAREILLDLNLAEGVKAKTVYGKDVRQVLNYVATGNIDAGIVYRSDTIDRERVRVVAIASAENHSPIVYPVAALKDSKHPQAAKQMLEFFFSPQAQAVFRKYGFVRVNQTRNVLQKNADKQLAINHNF